MDRLLERPDVVEGHPNFRGTLYAAEAEHDDRMRLIATRRGFALWSPLGAKRDPGAGILPAMVEVTVRDLDGRCALTLQQCMHPRTFTNLASLAALSLMWMALAAFGPALWVALVMLPAFMVLPLMSGYQAWIARKRSRRSWDALTETFAPLELTRAENWAPFRELAA